MGYRHLSPAPPTAGGSELVRFLTDGAEEFIGAKVVLSHDPVEAAEKLAKAIGEKRAKLGI